MEKEIARSCRGMSLSVVHESKSSGVPTPARTARFGSFGEEQQQASSARMVFPGCVECARGAALVEGARSYRHPLSAPSLVTRRDELASE